jgi:phage tail-like protein
MKYTNIKLSRPLTADTMKVTRWLAAVANAPGKQTAHIDAMTEDGTVVASWALEQVVPVRWTGPSLNVETPKVATETIEIAHHGFLPAGASGQN